MPASASGILFSAAPTGAKGCSHGWSGAAAQPPDAEPVGKERVFFLISPPKGAKEGTRKALIPCHPIDGLADHPPPSSTPSGWDIDCGTAIHGLRSPAAHSTRGYRPSPLRGEMVNVAQPLPRRALPCLMAAGLALLALALIGCSDHQKRTWRHRSPEENYRTALEADHADQRRDAVARIAESGYYRHDDAFQVLDVVARTDAAPQIRCIAVRALARYGDPRPVKPLLAILQATRDSAEALPPNDDVRWETATALAGLLRQDVVDEAARDLVRDIFIRLAERDASRNVRVVAIEALAEFQDPQVLQPLIRSLRNEDFGIVDRAERSLIALTGETHFHDADAWETWAAATDQPFARAGQTPAVTQPSGPSWWDRQARAWRRGLKLAPD